MSGYAVPVYLPRRRRIVTPGEWLREKIEEQRREREATITLAITSRTSGAAKTVGSGNLASIALPASHTTNDINAILYVAHDNVAPGTPAGWTKEFDISNGTTCRMALFWIRDNGSVTAPTITHTAGDSAVAQCFGFVGANTTGDPFILGTAHNDSGTGTGVTVTNTANDYDPTYTNSAILFLNGNTSIATDAAIAHASWSGTNPTFSTEVGEGKSDLGSGEAALGCAWGLTTDGAATGSRTVSAGPMPTGAWLAQSILVELKDASPTGGGAATSLVAARSAALRHRLNR